MMLKSRLLKAARNFPEKLPVMLTQALQKEENAESRILNQVLFEWVRNSPFQLLQTELLKMIELIKGKKGVQFAVNFLNRVELAGGTRKPTLSLYDHAMHYIGGAQKYGCTLASALQNHFDVTLIVNKPVTVQKLQQWYNLDLSLCKIKVVPIPFYELGGKGTEFIDPALVNMKGDNPFHIISKLSGDFDIFINNSMLEMVYPLSSLSVFVCHFPERERSRFFHVDKYTEIIFNSLYTSRWIESRWNLKPQFHLYPPVDMEEKKVGIEKKSIILSVSRFDPGGNKQQIEMIKAFKGLVKQFPELVRGWKLVLAGGSVGDNPYLKKIYRYLERFPSLDIEVKINVPEEELRAIYRSAKIFWHLCGLNQKDPAKVEHFGMNIVEAMQNECVPIVFDGGGQTEIVEEGISGYLFADELSLLKKTVELLNNPDRLHQLRKNVYEKGKQFHVDIFVEKVQSHFKQLLKNNLLF